MTTTVIPDPQALLPAMPPIVTVILHWLVVLVVAIYFLGFISSLLWGYYKDNWVRQNRTEYPVTKWSKRLDLWLPLMANLPQFLNKKAREKGLPAPFKFVPEDLSVIPPEALFRYGVRTRPGPHIIVRDNAADFGRGQERVVTQMSLTEAGLPTTAPWNQSQLAQAYALGEPYSEPSSPASV